MIKFLSSQAKITSHEIASDNLDPGFRKATMNMILAHTACAKVLANIPEVERESLPCIFGTHFGELDSSLNFLCTYRETKIPRPILFQNSLHNSTLGFVSMNLKLQGPGLTLSADRHTVRAVALTGDSLLMVHSKLLVCLIDWIPEPLVKHYLKQHPYLEDHLNHAKAFLFTRESQPNSQKPGFKSLTEFSFVI